MKKINAITIIISFVVVLLLLSNRSIARYYEVLDTIKVRFTIDEKVNVGDIKNYENNEL